MNIKELKELIKDLPDEMELAVRPKDWNTQSYKRVTYGGIQRDWHSNPDKDVADRVFYID